jgi:hypothetical protein
MGIAAVDLGAWVSVKALAGAVLDLVAFLLGFGSFNRLWVGSFG